MVVYTYNPIPQKAETETDGSQFQVSLVYAESSRQVRVINGDPVSKNQ